MTDQPIDYSDELRRFSIFQGLQPAQLRAIPASKPPVVRPGVTLFKQGEFIQRLYFVLEGTVELVRTNERGEVYLKRVVGPGQVLGRLEMDVPEGQLGTAKVLTPTQLLFIDRSVLQRLRNNVPALANQLDRSEVIGHLRATPYFAPLSDAEIRWLSDIVTAIEAPAQTTLFRQGEAAEQAYIVRQGRIRLEREDSGKAAWLSAGSVFGARSVIENRYRRSTAVAETLTRLYVLPASDLRNVIELYPRDDWYNDPTGVARLLVKAPMLGQLTPEERRHLAGYTMQVHFRQPHRIIVRQDQNDNYLYLLVHGRATALVTDEKGTPGPPQAVVPGAVFGETAVLLGEAAAATVETLTPTDWLRIHRLDFAVFMRDHPDVFARLGLSDALRRRYLASLPKFSWQQEGESVLLQTRRHWVILLRNLSGIILLIGLLLLVDLIINRVLSGTPSWWLGVQTLFVVCIPLPIGLWILLDYLNDYYIVTSRRVMRVDRVILVSEKVNSAPLDKVQEVRSDRTFWAQVFRYGHVRITTAGSWGAINFDFCPHSPEVVATLRAESTRAKIAAKPENQESIRRQLQDRLHLGLEERVDKRALTDEMDAGKTAAGRRFLLRALAGLEHSSDDRLIWRKHWLGLLWGLLPPILATFVLAGLVALGLFFGFFGSIETATLALAAVITLLILLAASAFWLWWVWTDWVNDLYIVSDQFIEHIEKTPLFLDERTAVTSYERVQNVTFTKPNPIAYLFNFGNVLIQTAAENGAILFRFVPQPDTVQTEILRRIERYTESQMELRRKQSQSDMADWFDAYNGLLVEDFRQSPRREAT